MGPQMKMPCGLLALLLVGCGGSSSETPPPLEPDPTSFRYTGPPLPRAEDERPIASEEAEVDEDDLPPGEKPKPAAATWGSGKPSRNAKPAAPPAASTLPAAPASPRPVPVAPGKN